MANKRFKAAFAKVDRTRRYTLDQALDLLHAEGLIDHAQEVGEVDHRTENVVDGDAIRDLRPPVEVIEDGSYRRASHLFEIDRHAFFFKHDLYEEPDVKSANGEPVVTRVLTIMLAEEY